MSDVFGIPYADVDVALTRTDEPQPIDDSSPFTGFAIAALLSLPLWIIVVGLIVLRVKS